MNEKEKQEYLEQYKKDKEKGVPFYPDILFKDAVISLVVFLLLIALAHFIGAPLEERANPADTSYTPRPEWYFLFLFQLLKYFPSKLEVVGVVIIPTLAIILLFILPLIDQSPKRYFLSRPIIVGATSLVVVGIVYLSIASYLETPPPAEAAQGDQTAALYAKNCAGCHGPTIKVEPGTNLHAIIAQGQHEGMPAWSADLTTDQIDALAGFILSPLGSRLFTENCGGCHEAPELVASDPQVLKTALEQGPAFPAHADVDVPQWTKTLSQEERTSLVNFLIAPDGQRLFQINCAPCHGKSVPFSGDEEQLRSIITQGGLHLEMPPWQEKLTPSELDTLARYVVDPTSVSDGQALFEKHCSSCHGDRIPKAEEFYSARETIATGGGHQTMPVWGDVLTQEQLDALVSYTLNAAEGTSLEAGQTLFLDNCSPCHGDFGEGGPNPTRPGDIIAPISSEEFLKTRDDFTLRAIISQGQPNFGMSPFGSSFGGPLEDTEIDAIVAYMRSWETNPPVELPPQVAPTVIPVSGAEIYKDLCTQCHGQNGEGGLGPSLRNPQFQAETTDQQIFDTISNGHSSTAMIAWGSILTTDQIQQLVEFIRQLKPGEEISTATSTKPAPPSGSTPTPTVPTGPTPAPGAVSYTSDVAPILKAKCAICHGNMGGWDSSSYSSVMTSGNHSPTVIPGDAENSLLAQKITGVQKDGAIMPPSGKLPQGEIQTILDWILQGALDN
jgi:mono/diheme cytochrome c family protein